jgi:acid phosphatase (class A)
MMKLTSNVRGGVVRTELLGRALACWLLVGMAAIGVAQESYLASSHLDGIALLPPPPTEGSSEAAADLATVRAVFHGRTPAQESLATQDAKLSFFLFSPAIGPWFQPGKLPKTEALYLRVRKAIQPAISAPKNHWKRRRPYQVDEQLSLGKPEPSYSYPSGHSTCGTVYAAVLAEVFPQKREAILAIGREIGWDRVIIGKHFPTDVFAGRVLGQAIARELLASPAFQRDLAEAKAEADAMCDGIAAKRPQQTGPTAQTRELVPAR